MDTNTVSNMLLNSTNKLGAVIDHLEKGIPLVEPATVAPGDTEPNPDVTDALAGQIRGVQSQVDSFYTWAQTH